MWIIKRLYQKVEPLLCLISAMYLGLQIGLFLADVMAASSTKSPEKGFKMKQFLETHFIPFKELFTRFSTMVASGVTAFAVYWVTVMDDATKKQIMDFLGSTGQWIAPLAAYVVWLGARAKKQGE